MASTVGRSPDAPAHITKGYERELKQERAVQTRERILIAAARAFAADGYAEVTLLNIAERAGMTKGAVYFHFKNKESLAVTIAEGFYQRMVENTETVTRLQRPPLESLVEFLRQTAQAFRDDELIQAGSRLQLEGSSVAAPMPAPFRTFGATVESWLAAAAKEGQLPDGVDPAALTRVLVEAYFGAQHISWVHSNWADIVERVDEIIHVILRVEAPRPRA